MALKRILIDAQAKFRKMMEENRPGSSGRIDNDLRGDMRCSEKEMCLRDELSETNRRLEQLNLKQELEVAKKSGKYGGLDKSYNNNSSSGGKIYETPSGKFSKNFDDNKGYLEDSPVNIKPLKKCNYVDSSGSSCNSNGIGELPLKKTGCCESADLDGFHHRKKSKKARRHRRRTDLDYHEDMEPPSPTPGPSRGEFGNFNDSITLSLENARLKNEIYGMQRLMSPKEKKFSVKGGMMMLESDRCGEIDLNLYEQLEGQERVDALVNELLRARDVLRVSKNETNCLKNEKFELINEMKELYGALDEKEKELRDYIRNYENRLRENNDQIAQERVERERERWSLLRHARDEAERSLALAAQLDIKTQQLGEARRHLSVAGYLSDQESVASVSRQLNGRVTPSVNNQTTTVGDRGSCSADSGVRGSSDRESGATSTGGNLSDSTADVILRTSSAMSLGTSTITLDNAQKQASIMRHRDSDSISLVSSNIYQSVVTPRDCASPSMSPMNITAFMRSLEQPLLSKSVEQLSGFPRDMEPIRRHKNLRTLSGRGGVTSTWGSISRVFSRSRHRSKTQNPNDADFDFGRNWSPLTEEGYMEKLRLLREASHMPMERWRAPAVLAWLEVALGMSQYGPKCADNIKSGKVLLELNDAELETCLKINNPMHRKKLRLAIEEHRNPELIRYPCISELGHTWVANEWLPDIGLAQYAEIFTKNMVDARMLEHLSRKEMEKYLNVTRKFHQASITHGVHLLRMIKYDRAALATRRLQCDTSDTDPIVWTNQRFIQWAKDIHLSEYADNLKDSGVHGALVVLEPSVNGETMATALGIPPSRQMIRRHLGGELEQLILPARYDTFSLAEPIYETPNYRNVQQEEQR